MFPPVDRVVYRSNPLEMVVCQLRFPSFFALEMSAPSEFQLALGDKYPFVETRKSVQFSFGPANTTGEQVQQTIYDFITEDGKYRISICSDFIAVQTASYTCWEDFRSHIVSGLHALVKSYPVRIFTRVGLRYVDSIDRQALQIQDVDWSDLIKGPVLGMISAKNLAETEISISSSSSLLSNGVDCCLFNAGLGGKTGAETEPGPVRFIIDTDFFSETPTIGVDNAISCLNKYNEDARNAFRWAITDKLHARLCADS